MFDIGFGELVLLALIALIVIGPERLPRVARSLGYWTGRARAYARNFTAELERQAEISELKNSIHPEIEKARREIQSATESAESVASEGRDRMKADD